MFKKINNQNNKGFTLLEMLVVIAIFGILTAVVIFNYGDFEENIMMTNIAHEVALDILEAQSYALSVKSYAGGANQGFEGGYGYYFFTNPGGGGGVMEKKENFIFFVDSENDNDKCDSCSVNSCSSEQECLSVNNLTRDVLVGLLCVGNTSAELIKINLGNGDVKCDDSIDSVKRVNHLNISFERPDPDAIIMATEDELNSYNSYSKAEILLESPKGPKRIISILSNGQINVEFLNN